MRSVWGEPWGVRVQTTSHPVYPWLVTFSRSDGNAYASYAKRFATEAEAREWLALPEEAQR